MNRRVRDLVAALFVIAGIGLALVAYFWFSGRLSTGHARRVLVRFSDVSGLRLGDPVEVLGVARGHVSRIELATACARVQLSLRRDVPVTEDTRFLIRSVSYLGSDRFVMVVPGTGRPAGAAHEFEGANEALNLEATLAKLDRLLSELDLASMTSELRQTKEQLISSIREALPDISSVAAGATGELKRIADGIDTVTAMLTTESTARKLLTSDSLYNELRASNNQLQALLTDIRERPERYIQLRLR